MKYKISAFIISLILALGGILRFSHTNKEMQIYNSTEKFTISEMKSHLKKISFLI